MTKINQEEYKILLEMNREYNWIARDRDGQLWVYYEKPVKSITCWYEKGTTNCKLCCVKDVFKFIEWCDNEPYHIRELIEEYEGSVEFGYKSLKKDFQLVYGDTESEETEVKKDIEWLLQRIYDERVQLAQSFAEGKETDDESAFNDGKDRALASILRLIDQLDEPETLSQEWIDDNSIKVDKWNELVHVDRLQNLLVPKQEEITEETYEKYGMSEARWKEVVERYKWHLEQEGYAVIERPTIPQFVADWIETHKTFYSLYEVLWQAWNEDLDDHRLQKWIDNYSENHDEVFACAWLAYPNIEVEEEQKYYVLDSKDIPLLERPNNQTYKATTALSIQENGRDISKFKLTEQEIKNYDERYWAFAVPVKEEEE